MGRTMVASLALMTVLAVVLISPAGLEAQDVRQVAHVKLKGEIQEGPALFSLFGIDEKQTLREYLRRFNQAADDKNVDAVIITLDSPAMGWPQMLELRQAVKTIRDNGKQVWVFVESATAMDYMLATAADRIYIAPAGGVELVGLRLQMVFFKGLLDKIGVKADLLQVGKFKGAREPFTRETPSPEMLGEVNGLLDSLYGQMVEVIASGRNLEPAKVRELIDAGPYLAADAADVKLIDKAATRGQLVDDLQAKLGGRLSVQNHYGVRKSKLKLDFSNPFALLKMLMDNQKAPLAPNRIALVYIDGVITSGQTEDGLFGGRAIGSESIRRGIDKARIDPGVKAIVVRIDSPGGSALASDVIWTALKRAADAKPVVISVGNMAASGGYYIAAAGPVIFAEPTSIVGSIGVVGGKLVLGDLFEKIGVNTVSVSRGANADLFDATAPFTERHRKIVQHHMQKTYEQFLQRVRDGRGDKIEDLDAVAQGRVFIGEAAKRNGMIDRIGGLDDALRYAVGRAKVDKYEIQLVPEPKSLIDVLTGNMGDEDAQALAGWQRRLMARDAAGLEVLNALMPEQLTHFSRQLIMLRQLQREQVLAIWPVPVSVK